MEQMLLELDLRSANDEELNGIFRCAHSIKGGSATFGFADVAELTHQMESLLDRLRRHEGQAVAQMVDGLLESADAARHLLARHQAGGQGQAVSTTALLRRIADLAAGLLPDDAAAAASAASATAAAAATPAPVRAAPKALAPAFAGQARALEIRIGPLERPEQADAIRELVRDIPRLGSIRDLAGAPANARWFAVQTAASNEELLDLLAFHVAKEQVQLRDAAAAPVAPSAARQAPYEFFTCAPGAPHTAPLAPGPAPDAGAESKAEARPKGARPKTGARPKAP